MRDENASQPEHSSGLEPDPSRPSTIRKQGGTELPGSLGEEERGSGEDWCCPADVPPTQP